MGLLEQVQKNPRLATAELWLNGEPVNFKSSFPGRIFQFTFKDNIADGISDWTFAVIDTNYESIGESQGGISEVEKQIIQVFNRQYKVPDAVEFQFGWFDENFVSPKYTGFLLDYNPVFQYLATNFTIIGKGRPWYEGTMLRRTASYEGRISDIARQIAAKNNWESDNSILDTASFINHAKSEKASPDPMIYNQVNEPDLVFLEKLARMAVSQNTNNAGYIVYMRGNKLFFTIPHLAAAPVRSYTYPDPTGTVVSFSPHLQGPAALGWGVGKLILRGVDTLTGDPIDATVSNEQNSESKVSLGGQTFEPPLETGFIANHIAYTAAMTQKEALAQAKAIYEGFYNAVYYGELTIVGDPTIFADNVINIQIVLPNGQPHHTSGLWWVQNAIHNINNGVYTTTLVVLKNAIRTDLEPVVGPINVEQQVKPESTALPGEAVKFIKPGIQGTPQSAADKEEIDRINEQAEFLSSLNQ